MSKGPRSKPGHGGRLFYNWKYYRDHLYDRRRYFQEHHWQWRNMKRFARETKMPLAVARQYIDQKLRPWYIENGYLAPTPPRERRRGRVWRSE